MTECKHNYNNFCPCNTGCEAGLTEPRCGCEPICPKQYFGECCAPRGGCSCMPRPCRSRCLRGLSAYEIAVEEGYEGTLEEWLASLIGPQGPAGAQGPQGEAGSAGTPGTNGLSAYELAVAEGYVGTREEWLASLVGPQGPAGAFSEAGFASNLLMPTLTLASNIPFPDTHMLTTNVRANTDSTVFTVAEGGMYLISYQLNLTQETQNYTVLYLNDTAYQPSRAGHLPNMRDHYSSTVLVNLPANSTISLRIYGEFTPQAILAAGGNSISIVRVR